MFGFLVFVLKIHEHIFIFIYFVFQKYTNCKFLYMFLYFVELKIGRIIDENTRFIILNYTLFYMF